MMNSTLISQVEKATRYAQQPERIQFQSFSVLFHGDNSDHQISWDGTHWHSDSTSFAHYGVCAHIMALQRILEPMLSPAARQSTEGDPQAPAIPYSTLIAKIEKANRYATEPERITFSELRCTVRGDNADHVVCWDGQSWDCDSPTFRRDGVSAHVMALQRLLGPMLSPQARMGADHPAPAKVAA